MSSKAEKKHRHFSKDFQLRLLKEFYESGTSMYALSKKYGLDYATFYRWVRNYASKPISLPEDLSELENQVYMARKKSEASKQTVPMTENERLRDENERLRKALAYSELRNEALHEVLKIGREKYGIDLLKKAGAKQ